MIDDLISRQAAVELCLRYNGIGWVWSKILDELKEMPAAVVQCKDCIYCESNTDESVAWCNVWGNTTICDGYCFHGERKNEG